ncbi:hypothetical protein PsorP6_015057 [Peronosclerospora sorghi]|uniref:Uncharacterized protein n=1 Tax=Peronosclerospora sorghi TaxID=230839 RepID=A0ACC0VSS2_9STRA|nr:hypothetical protein PsorP6_015057 [Peronosclerospora sorghi]
MRREHYSLRNQFQFLGLFRHILTLKEIRLRHQIHRLTLLILIRPRHTWNQFHLMGLLHHILAPKAIRVRYQTHRVTLLTLVRPRQTRNLC